MLMAMMTFTFMMLPTEPSTVSAPSAPSSAPSAPPATSASPSVLPASAHESRYPQLERLYSDDHADEGRAAAAALLKQHPDDVELHVLYARFLYEIGERHKRDAAFDKVKLYTEMVEVLERAMTLSRGDPRVGWGLGVARGRLATTKGILASLSEAKRIEQLWVAAARGGATYKSLNGEEHLPCDAYLTLGVFYRLLPDWWIVELVAGVRGDVDRAITWLEKATTCAPQTIRSRKELGVAYLCAAKKKSDPSFLAKGQAELRRGLSLPAQHGTEKIDHRHMQRLLDAPDDACAYSRDGQQALDEKNVVR